MCRSGQPPEFDGLDELERLLHIRARLQRAMAVAETQEQLIERLTRDLATRDAALATERAEKEQANERARQAEGVLAQYPLTAEDYMHPTLVVPESAILIPENSYEIRTQFLIELKNNAFHGRFNECPLEHIINFSDMCRTLAEGTTLEYIKMKAF